MFYLIFPHYFANLLFFIASMTKNELSEFKNCQKSLKFLNARFCVDSQLNFFKIDKIWSNNLDEFVL